MNILVVDSFGKYMGKYGFNENKDNVEKIGKEEKGEKKIFLKESTFVKKKVGKVKNRFWVKKQDCFLKSFFNWVFTFKEYELKLREIKVFCYESMLRRMIELSKESMVI